MITYRPPIEPRKNLLAASSGVARYHHRAIMTRQAICALLRSLPQKNVILPRFVPAGVYHPVIETGKKIHYYEVPMDLRVDRDEVLAHHLDPSDTIFYYVHQFGLHIEENIALMREMQQRGYYVIDDRSLTLPVSSYEEFGDATPYSFYKLVGLPFGGEVRTKRDTQMIENSAGFTDNEALMHQMKKNFMLYSNHALPFVPQLPYRVINRMFAKHVRYCSLSKAPWSERLPELPTEVDNKLDRMDFEAITKRRTEIAGKYYDGIPASARLPLPKECFVKQSAVGFLILTDDPLRMLKYLVRLGIVTSRFIDIWWWDKTLPECELYRRNLLIPAHQGMTDREVDHVIESVNAGLRKFGEVRS